MSTKTAFKRVALVAAAALAIGGLSAVSANAAGSATTPYYISTAGSASLALDGSGTNAATETATQIAGPANYVEITANANLATSTSVAVVSVSGSTATISANGSTTWTANTASTIQTSVGQNVTGSIIRIATPAAGTITATVAVRTGPVAGVYTDTTVQTFTINVSASAAAATFSASSSTAFIGATATVPVADTALVVGKSSGTAVATILLSLKNSIGSAYTGTDVTAVVTGAGLIEGTAGTNTAVGNSRVATVTNSAGAAHVNVAGDGTAGVATVVISVGSTVFATKTVTFYGASTSLSAANASNYIAAAGSEVTTVTVKDASGNLVGGDLVTAVSSNTAVATVAGLAATSSAGLSTFTVTGVGAGTATITYTNAAATATATAVINVTGATATTTTLGFDKASYAPGEKMTLTLTLKDSTGAPIADQTGGTVFAAGGLVSNVALQGAVLTGLTATTVAGVTTFVVYAPLVGGTVTVSGTTASGGIIATAGQALAVSASATVAADTSALDAANAAADAAAEATDAANAATDAANAAADAADSATSAAQDAADQAGQALAAVNTLATSVAALVAGIKAQITSLTNLVVKLQKAVSVLPKK